MTTKTKRNNTTNIYIYIYNVEWLHCRSQKNILLQMMVYTQENNLLITYLA